MGEGQPVKVGQLLLVALLAGQAPEKEGRRVNEAQKRIEEFRQGGKFSGSAGALAASGKASDQDVRTLTEAVRTEPADIREKGRKLLVDLGRETDSLYNARGRLT